MPYVNVLYDNDKQMVLGIAFSFFLLFFSVVGFLVWSLLTFLVDSCAYLSLCIFSCLETLLFVD